MTEPAPLIAGETLYASAVRADSVEYEGGAEPIPLLALDDL